MLLIGLRDLSVNSRARSAATASAAGAVDVCERSPICGSRNGRSHRATAELRQNGTPIPVQRRLLSRQPSPYPPRVSARSPGALDSLVNHYRAWIGMPVLSDGHTYSNALLFRFGEAPLKSSFCKSDPVPL